MQHAVPFPFWCLGVTQATSFPSVLFVSLKGTRKVREGFQASQCGGGSAEPREGAAGDAEHVP